MVFYWETYFRVTSLTDQMCKSCFGSVTQSHVVMSSSVLSVPTLSLSQTPPPLMESRSVLTTSANGLNLMQTLSYTPIKLDRLPSACCHLHVTDCWGFLVRPGVLDFCSDRESTLKDTQQSPQSFKRVIDSDAVASAFPRQWRVDWSRVQSILLS